MGGWIAAFGDVSTFERRVEQFRRLFGVDGMPELHARLLIDRADLKLLGWAWHPSLLPDLHAAEVERGSILLCGAVTGIGGDADGAVGSVESLRRIACGLDRDPVQFPATLNGSFSVLRVNADGELRLWTDRFASRSVWYGKEHDTWLVGNFAAGIASLRMTPREIELASLWSLLHTGRPIGPFSLVSGIRSLRAGQKLAVGRDSHRVDTWFERRYRPEHRRSSNETAEALASALRTSAERYARVSPHMHVFLSGGLDSRLAAGALRDRATAVTVITRPNAESRLAESVAKALRMPHRTLQRDPMSHLRTMQFSSLISGGNYLLHHIHFTDPVARIVRECPHASFVFGDMLENLSHRYFRPSAPSPPPFDVDAMPAFMSAYVSSCVTPAESWGEFLRPEPRERARRAYQEALRDCFATVAAVSDCNADRLDTFFRWNAVSATYTFNMFLNLWPLCRERNLYFDNDLDQLAASIPSGLRSAGRLHSKTLHALASKLAYIPDANDFLPPITPRTLRRLARAVRPKLGRLRRSLVSRRRGSDVPTSGSWLLRHEMYRNHADYRDAVSTVLTDPQAFPEPLFDRPRIEATWRRYLAGDATLNLRIDALLSFGTLSRQLSLVPEATT